MKNNVSEGRGRKEGKQKEWKEGRKEGMMLWNASTCCYDYLHVFVLSGYGLLFTINSFYSCPALLCPMLYCPLNLSLFLFCGLLPCRHPTSSHFMLLTQTHIISLPYLSFFPSFHLNRYGLLSPMV